MLQEIIPLKIRAVSLSLVFFMMGRWLGTDTYFSVYVKEVVGNTWWVSVIWAILALVKLFFNIPIWRMNDKVDMKYILLMWKILYVFCGLFFFFAWILHSWILLLLAVIFDWIANATIFTTYRSYYSKRSTKSDSAKMSWIYFSATYVTKVIGSLIAAILVNYLELPYMYFFVVIFSLVSLLQDEKINTVFSKNNDRTWKSLYRRLNDEKETPKELYLNQKFFGKKWFVYSFFNGCLSTESWKEIWQILHKYDLKMYVALWSWMLSNFFSYMSFLFIPIVAVENNFSLSQIAIVFAAMKLPYIVNLFVWKFWDKYSKKILISIILILMSWLFIAIWFSEHFYAILVLTFCISTWVALLNPLTLALVVSYTHSQDKWSLMWVQGFVWRLWDIIWSLWFWTLTTIIWLKNWFIIIWLCTFWLWWYLLFKKLISFRGENNKRENLELK